MKRISILALVLLSVSLAPSGVGQVGSPANTDSSSQTKQTKPSASKTQKDKAAKASKPPIKSETGKKTTSSQDAAYALAYKQGIPK